MGCIAERNKVVCYSFSKSASDVGLESFSVGILCKLMGMNAFVRLKLLEGSGAVVLFTLDRFWSCRSYGHDDAMEYSFRK